MARSTFAGAAPWATVLAGGEGMSMQGRGKNLLGVLASYRALELQGSRRRTKSADPKRFRSARLTLDELIHTIGNPSRKEGGPSPADGE